MFNTSIRNQVIAIFLLPMNYFSGVYLFIESSPPRKPGDNARLYSKVFNETQANGECFIFYYHMRGSSIGTLNVHLDFMNGTEILIWTMTGNQGNKWFNGQVAVGGNMVGVEYQVRIFFIVQI